MVRALYWHLTPEEVKATPYPVGKLVHWEIRCGFSESSYFSVFWFRGGVPFDKEPMSGLGMYVVECSDEVRSAVEEFLRQTVGGSIVRKSQRTFISEAKVSAENEFIVNLATQLTGRFKAGSEIWLEFEGLAEEESKQLFPSKFIQVAK